MAVEKEYCPVLYEAQFLCSLKQLEKSVVKSIKRVVVLALNFIEQISLKKI
jgi:hypothetical protein